MKTLHLITLIFFFNSIAQDFGTRTRQFLVMDIVSGAIVSGVGSAIHKKENKTIAGAFLSGAWKGAIGGSLTFYGKYRIADMRTYRGYEWAWPAKLIHAAGASMIENGAQGNKIYSNFGIDFGPLRLDIGAYKQRLRFQPFSAASIGVLFIQGYNLNIKRSFVSGTVHFESRSMDAPAGKNLWNCVMTNYAKNPKRFSFFNNQYSTTGHEIIHTFQFREFQAMNYWVINNDSRFIYFDLPSYFIPYGIGEIQHQLGGRYYSNPYELQAESLARRNPVNWIGKNIPNQLKHIPNLPY